MLNLRSKACADPEEFVRRKLSQMYPSILNNATIYHKIEPRCRKIVTGLSVMSAFLLLFIHCSLLPPLFGGGGVVLGLCLVLQYLVSFLVLEERAGCLLLLCSECHITVNPRGAMGWSVVCDCGSSWSNSLTFFPRTCPTPK